LNFESLKVGDWYQTSDEKYHQKKIKESMNKNGIPKDAYYLLLEWKDENLKEFQSKFGEVSLNSLDYSQLQRLYQEIILGIK